LHTLRGHIAFVSSLAFSRDSKHLVSGSRDKTVKVWDLARLDKRLKE
jgi:WD40 repeat protein